MGSLEYRVTEEAARLRNTHFAVVGWRRRRRTSWGYSFEGYLVDRLRRHLPREGDHQIEMPEGRIFSSSPRLVTTLFPICVKTLAAGSRMVNIRYLYRCSWNERNAWVETDESRMITAQKAVHTRQ